MEPIPADLLAALPESGRAVAEQWWATLSASERQQLVHLWDARLEVEFFAPQPDETGQHDHPNQVPTVLGGHFVPHDDDGRAEWQPGYFEHLLQHPELVLAYEPVRRTFHIGCTLHAAARQCLATGYVPRTFVCPVGTAACPLLPLRGCKLSHHAE